jgi:hypothetical protein
VQAARPGLSRPNVDYLVREFAVVGVSAKIARGVVFTLDRLPAICVRMIKRSLE